jgi:hypothetical protein
MDDQDDIDFDVGRVEKEKEDCDEVSQVRSFLMNTIILQLLQNLGHDGDDESENGLSATDKPAKPKRDRAAIDRKYRNRPDVIARRQLNAKAKKDAAQQSRLEKGYDTDQGAKKRRELDAIVESASLSQDNHGFDEVS